MPGPVQVTDATLRDGVEKFVLRLLRQEELGRLGKLLDRVGFYAIDCWGGATFLTALTELQEDPWERLKRLRRAIRNTPLQMVVRGQMLVGHRPYSKELVRKFLVKAASLGIDIFRIYDQLNDLENLRLAIEIAKELRKSVEATVLFSLNPNITLDDYLLLADELLALGADAICLNDSLGFMTPDKVATLVTRYRKKYHQPLRLHLHDNHQQALESYLVGIRAGAERVDTVVAPLAWPEGPPPLESLVFSLGGTLYDPQIDMAALEDISNYITQLKDVLHYEEPPAHKPEDRSEPGYLPHLLKDYLREELRRRQARDRQHEVFKEAHQVWADLGFLPLKGRILEIIGDQAVLNVFEGRRYATLTQDMVDLISGRHGPLYSLANETLRQQALAAREAAREQSREAILRQPPGLTQEEDLITYALFPEEAETFFNLRAARQAAPAPVKATPPAVVPASPPGAKTGSERRFPDFPRGLSLNLKGENVIARLVGLGHKRGNCQTLFINIGDLTEELEVKLISGSGTQPEYLITLHGETYRLKLKKVFPKAEEYTPIFFDINDQIQEFLIKHLYLD